MSALPNPLQSHQLPKKPAGRAAKPKRLWEGQRKSSDYEKGTGYAPFFFGFLADWGRISSGHIADMMLMVICAKSIGRTVAKGKPREEWTEDLTYSDVAQLAAASDEWPKMLRSVEREFARWQTEGIAEVVKSAPGTVKVRLRYREWVKVNDYRSNVVEMPEAPAEDEPEAEEEAREGYQKFKPVTLAPGKACKPLPIKTGTKELQYQVAGSVDIRFVTVIQAGCQTITASVPDEWIQKLGKTKVVLPETKGLQEKFGRGCRTSEENSGKVAAHPRAAELSAIFDPLLKKSQARLLSTDESSLLAACAAVGAMPVNDLIHGLNGGASPRAARPISSPKHVAKIISELKANWEKSGGVPDVQLPKAAKTGRKSFKDSVMDEAARRLERFGRL
jgi:hypothetical protein